MAIVRLPRASGDDEPTRQELIAAFEDIDSGIMFRDADAYAYKVLQKLRDQVGQVAQTVDRGLAELEARNVQNELPNRVGS